MISLQEDLGSECVEKSLNLKENASKEKPDTIEGEERLGIWLIQITLKKLYEECGLCEFHVYVL